MNHLILILISLSNSFAGETVIKIGHLYDPSAGKLTSLAVLQLAEQNLRNDGIIDNSIKFQYYSAQSASTEYMGVGPASDLHCKYDVDAFIGPASSTPMATLLPAATYWDTTVVGFVSTAVTLSNKTQYPTFARVSSTVTSCGIATRELLLQFGWTSIAVINGPSGQTSTDGFLAAIKGYDIQVTYQYTFPAGQITTVQYQKILNIVRMKARVIYVCFSFNPWDSRDFMLAARSLNMTDSDFVYIIPFAAKNTIDQPNPWVSCSPTPPISDEVAKEAYRAAMIVEASGSDTSSLVYADSIFDNFSLSDKNLRILGINDEVVTQKAFRLSLYFAMYLYGLAVRTCLDSNVTNFHQSGTLMFQCFCYQSFKGFGVDVSTNANAERVADYSVKTIDFDGNYTTAFRIHAEDYLCPNSSSNASQITFTYRTSLNNSISTNLSVNKTICGKSFEVIRINNWRTPDNLPPLAIPQCGFDGSQCQTDKNSTLITVCSVVSVIVILSIGIFCFNKQRQLQQMKSMNFTWKVPCEDVKLVNHWIQGSLNSIPDVLRSVRSYNADKHLKHQTIGPGGDLDPGHYVTVICKGNLAVCKRLIRVANQFDVKEADLLLLKRIFEANHENLNRFIGLSIDNKGKNIFILWNHGAKGSLRDILQGTEIEMDFALKSSVVRDILQGLEYLHNKSHLECHGNLRTSNCLISSRWVVVLSDFGVDKIFGPRLADGSVTDQADFISSAGSTPGDQRTKRQVAVVSKEADIFNFGEVLYEVITRESMAETMVEAIDLLQKHSSLGPFFKEKTEKEDHNHNVIKLFKETRLAEACNRPTVARVKSIFASCSYSATNLVDHMFGIMEKYANSLESLVNERTSLLQEERIKADALLYQMLPKEVAEALKIGVSVEPETFDLATVYFSDVVGFTTICSDSSPMEVVAMLNSLYSQFDEIIGRHDCYKVETIGDAYLVVSGLPSRNGQQHVVEISDMAIEIMRFVTEKFVIPHMPSRQMSVRIGIHSGPIAAGVVGLSMPRYCVFGDTVNVASRMESQSLPSKIQISWTTAALLASLPNYTISPRGQNVFKGKGLCTTYWLEGGTDEPNVIQ